MINVKRKVNTYLRMGGGVCGAIFKAAGVLELQAACDKLAPIKTGEAAITPGFALSAKYIIHAAGPVPMPQMAKPSAAAPSAGIDDLVGNLDEPFSTTQKFDVIVEYFIINGKYDIFKINEVLFKYDQPLLGG